MKPIISYSESNLQMGDLLIHHEVPLKEFTFDELEDLRENLIDYMCGGHSGQELKIDLKSIYLVIKGSDEASYLLQYL